MPGRRFNRAGGYGTAPGMTQAKTADGFMDCIATGVSISHPAEQAQYQHPDYIAPICPPTVWGPQLVDIGFRHVRDQYWVWNDNYGQVLRYLGGLGIGIDYIVWDRLTYTYLLTADVPIPDFVEGLNEYYGATYGPQRSDGRRDTTNGSFFSTAQRGQWATNTVYAVGDQVQVNLTVQSITLTGGVATVTFTGNHQLIAGCSVWLNGVNGTGALPGQLNNGSFTVASVPAANQVTLGSGLSGTWTSGGYSGGGYGFTCIKAHTSGTDNPNGDTQLPKNSTMSPNWVTSYAYDNQQVDSQWMPNLKARPGWGNLPITSISTYLGGFPHNTLNSIGRLANTTLGNLHQYQFGAMMEAYFDQLVTQSTLDPISGGQPWIMTEWGYHAGPPDGNSEIDVASAATYMIRNWMYGYGIGIRRMSQYGFRDEQNDPQYGGQISILRSGLCYNDATYKPVAQQLRGVTRLLNDPGPGFALQQLSVQWSGSTANLTSVLMQKRNGRFYLAFWLKVECVSNPFNNPTYIGQGTIASPAFTPGTYGTGVPVHTNQNVTATIGNQSFSAANLYQAPTNYGTATAVGSGSTFALTATEQVQVLELIP